MHGAEVADRGASTVGELVKIGLPRSTAPALFKRRTTSASSERIRSLNNSLAAVVRIPAVSMFLVSKPGRQVHVYAGIERADR
jgi:hypothetical protein